MASPGQSEAVSNADPPGVARQAEKNAERKQALSLDPWWIVAALIGLALVLAVSGCFADKGLLTVGLLTLFPLSFILLDLARFGTKGSEPAKDGEPGKTRAFHPDFRVWGNGLLLGVSVAAFYLLATVIMALLNNKPSQEQMWQNLAILLVLSAVVCSIVWGVVRLARAGGDDW